MDLQSRKYQIIEELMSVQSAEKLRDIEAILRSNQEEIDPEVQEEMTARARRAEEDIQQGRVYSYEQAQERLSGKLKNHRG